MSELRNAAAKGANSLGRSMKAEYAKTQQRARNDGNSQQKSVTAFAEDEVAERARTSAVAAGQTARRVGRTAVQHSPQSADELKRQAQITKAKIDKVKTAAAEEAKTNAAASKQPPSHSAGAATETGGSPSYALQKPDGAKQAYRQKNAAKMGAASKQSVKGAPSVKSAGNAMGKTAGRTFSYTGNSARTATHAATGAANAAKAAYKRRQQAKMAAEASRKTVRGTVKAIKVAVKSTKALITLLIAGGWVSVMIILIVVVFGCAISMFGGGSNSKSYTAVSVEVRDYRPIIQQYAKEHGIPEYTDLIMAVMMQESGGQGLDPMCIHSFHCIEEIMHTLFALEDMYGLSVENIDGKICVIIPEPSCDESFVVSMFLETWSDIAQEYREGRISKENYDEWRYQFPYGKRPVPASMPVKRKKRGKKPIKKKDDRAVADITEK